MKEYSSKYRQWMLQYFKENEDQMFCAPMIYQAMRDNALSINLATVYRNLERLEKDGELHSVMVKERNEKYYQYVEPGHDCAHHLHLYCRSCGRMIHLDCGFMDEITDHLEKEHGFELDCRDSVLVGLCDACRKKERKS